MGIAIKYEPGTDGGSNHSLVPTVLLLPARFHSLPNTQPAGNQNMTYGHQTQAMAGTDEHCPASMWDDALSGSTANIMTQGKGNIWVAKGLDNQGPC